MTDWHQPIPPLELTLETLLEDASEAVRGGKVLGEELALLKLLGVCMLAVL
jgi:hypothetical protein